MIIVNERANVLNKKKRRRRKQNKHICCLPIGTKKNTTMIFCFFSFLRSKKARERKIYIRKTNLTTIGSMQ